MVKTETVWLICEQQMNLKQMNSLLPLFPLCRRYDDGAYLIDLWELTSQYMSNLVQCKCSVNLSCFCVLMQI